jgi:hypothetical protein
MPMWKGNDNSGLANNKPAWLTHMGIEQPRANSYIANTVLITASRKANSNTSAITAAYGKSGIAHTGWVNITKGTGGRAGRVTSEVLVAMSTPVSTNTSSGGIYFTGL